MFITIIYYYRDTNKLSEMKMRNLLKRCVWMHIVLLVLLTFPTNVKAAYTSTEIALTTYSPQTIVISENNTAVVDVLATFDALTHHSE